MSKVIKAPIWKEDVHVIDVPSSKKTSQTEVPENSAFDAEAQERMLEEIAEKEQQVSRMLQEARVSCDIMRQEAQKEHDRLIADAQEEIERLRNQARDAGHQEGFDVGKKEGREQALREMQEAIKDANEKAMHTLKTAKEATVDYMVQAEQDVAEIVMHVAEKIIPQHFIDVPQVVLPVVKQALMKVKDQKEINIHVSPEGYELVLMARDEFRSLLPGGNAAIEIVSDESLQAGDCLIETPNGGVDARLSTQIELIKKAVQEVLT